MRFSTALTSLVFAALAAAAPAPGKGGNTVSQCAGGQTYCCNSINQPVDASSGDLLSVPLNVILSPQCTPISVLAIVLQSNCASSTVCCQDMGTNGLVNVQCVGLAI